MTGNWTVFVQKTAGTTDLDQNRTHNKVNELTNITETTGTAWVTPVQDKTGNITTVPKPSSLASGLTLTYDAWNRLAEVKDGQTVVGKYEYDGLNRRVRKHLDSQSPGGPDGLDTYVHYFYNSSWQLLETRQTTTESDQPENIQPKYQHVWSPRYIDAPILRDENTDQDSLCDDQRLYYLTDANFNVTSLVDASGDAVEHYLYDPYGKPTIYNATWSSTQNTSSYNNVVLYTGRELEPESGVVHYRNRYYSPELGRFVSRDPIGYIDAINLVAYVAGRPTVLSDPIGMQALNCALKHLKCLNKNDRRYRQCRSAGLGFCAGVCQLKFGGKPFKGIPCKKWTCFGACTALYWAACDADDGIGQTCCNNAFRECRRTGRWPGTWWRFLRGCPIGF